MPHEAWPLLFVRTVKQVVAAFVAITALIATGVRVDAGPGRRRTGRTLGVRRLSEQRSGPVVVSQQVDLAPGFRKLPMKRRLGRDHHGAAMEVDDSLPGTLRFSNPRARGLPITEVRAWDGVKRRWRVVFLEKRERRDQAPAAVASAPRINREQVPASGRIDRPVGDGVASVQLTTYLGRASGIARLSIDVFDRSARPMNYHLELSAAAVAEALAGLPVEEAGWQLDLSRQALELRSTRGETLQIDRLSLERLWGGAPLGSAD